MAQKLKITILSLSFLTIITGAAVAPSLSVIQAYFSSVETIYIKLILTLPALVLIPFSIISGKCAQRYSKKKIIIFGLLLYTVGGVGGAFAFNITSLLIMRIILGVGIGIILPLSTGLIADFYSGEERTRIMGWSTAVNNLGAVLAIMLSSSLSKLSWRYIFLIYGVAVVVLLMVILILKDPPKEEYKAHKIKINKRKLFNISMSMFVLQVIFNAIPTNLSLFVAQEGIGSGGIAGVLLSLLTLSSFFAGVFYSRIRFMMNGYIIPISVSSISFGFVVLSLSSHTLIIGLSVMIVGFASGLLLPTFILMGTETASGSETSMVLAIISSSLFFGQFMAPIISNFVQVLVGIEDIRMPFYTSAVLSVVFLIYLARTRKSLAT